MSKSPKFTSYEEALEALEAAKAEQKAARTALDSFGMKNKLPKGKDHSENKEHGKTWSKLNKAWQTAKDARMAIEEAAKALKPARAERTSKYEYPEDCVTADQKKKFRAAQRAEKKRAEKGETPKKEKKVQKEEKAQKPAKADKKSEKLASKPEKKKKAKPVDDEDED
jgi:hypothetical protein